MTKSEIRTFVENFVENLNRKEWNILRGKYSNKELRNMKKQQIAMK